MSPFRQSYAGKPVAPQVAPVTGLGAAEANMIVIVVTYCSRLLDHVGIIRPRLNREGLGRRLVDRRAGPQNFRLGIRRRGAGRTALIAQNCPRGSADADMVLTPVTHRPVRLDHEGVITPIDDKFGFAAGLNRRHRNPLPLIRGHAADEELSVGKTKINVVPGVGISTPNLQPSPFGNLN